MEKKQDRGSLIPSLAAEGFDVSHFDFVVATVVANSEKMYVEVIVSSWINLR